MLKDKTERLEAYYPLDDRLRDDLEKIELPTYYGFIDDTDSSTLFIVSSGSITAATSWRENKESREPIAAVRAYEGEFVLYLPGEPMLVKADDDAEVEVYRTKNE